MKTDPDSAKRSAARARWIAAGFLIAFAASILTVIYTGLMVEGSPSEFDAGFRSVALRPGETRTIELRFDVRNAPVEARLEVELPAMLEPVATPGAARIARPVAVVPGNNAFAVEVRATAVSNGYVVARLVAAEPIALERVFVTVEPE